MHVAVYIGNLRPQDGGAYTFELSVMKALAARLAETRHRFTLFAAAPMPMTFGQQTVCLPIVRCPPHHMIMASAATAKDRLLSLADRLCAPWKYATAPVSARATLDRLLARNRCDCVWFPTHSAVPVDVPYIAVLWDLEHRVQPFFPEVSSHGVWQAREAHFKHILPRAARIVVGTQLGKSQVERFYHVPAESIHVVPMPVPDFTPDNSGTFSHRPESTTKFKPGYFFYPGQFWPHKNHATLLKAFALLRDEPDSPRLVLTGSDKGNRDYVGRLVKDFALEDRVSMLGFVPQDVLRELYEHACALVYPSLFGPDNLPPLEAFALGCPVIGPDLPGAREQLGDAALLVDPLDATAIARAMVRVRDDAHLRTTLVAKGRFIAEGRTTDAYVRRMFEIFDAFEPVRACWP